MVNNQTYHEENKNQGHTLWLYPSKQKQTHDLIKDLLTQYNIPTWNMLKISRITDMRAHLDITRYLEVTRAFQAEYHKVVNTIDIYTYVYS